MAAYDLSPVCDMCGAPLGDVLEFEGLALDGLDLTIEGRHYHLSPKRSIVLKLLMQARGRCVLYNSFEDVLWGETPIDFLIRQNISAYIYILREHGVRIRTIVSQGYALGGENSTTDKGFLQDRGAGRFGVSPRNTYGQFRKVISPGILGP